MTGMWDSGKSFSSGWSTPYFQEVEKWLPIYWPPYYWQVRDSSYPPQHAPMPYGFLAPWWLHDKSQWPYEVIPWNQKVFGAISARKIWMWSKYPNPPGELKSSPPFGTMKVDTPTDRPHSIGTLRIQMRPEVWLEINPLPSLWDQAKLENALRIMSRIRPIKLQTADGGSITIKKIEAAPWNQYNKEYQERRAEMKAKREAEHQEMLAKEIASYDSKQKPSVDLFS
jgi:hypothetical protein